MSSFVDFQNEIYLSGLAGTVPALPMTAAGLEERAREVLDPAAFAYVAGSASAERTAHANLAAFEKYRLLPRILRGASGPGARDLSVEVLGTHLAAPILTAPVGVLGLLHERGETVVAEVTRELGIGMCLSTAASSTIEEVGERAGDWWYQLYWPNDTELARSFVERAEKSGAKAIVVTADTPAWAGGPAICSSGTCRSFRARALPTTYPIRSSAPGSPPRPSRAPRRCRRRSSPGSDFSGITVCARPISPGCATGPNCPSP